MNHLLAHKKVIIRQNFKKKYKINEKTRNKIRKRSRNIY